jgi:hypothetical protein
MPDSSKTWIFAYNNAVAEKDLKKLHKRVTAADQPCLTDGRNLLIRPTAARNLRHLNARAIGY